jgi:hypothetical protein
MRSLSILAWSAGILAAVAAFSVHQCVQAAAGPAEQPAGEYRVLAPIESGDMLLFPVVRTNGKQVNETPFLTLDEGIASGEVEVTEAGRVRGLVRTRPAVRRHPGDDGNYAAIPEEIFDHQDRGDQVNTLVLVNHSKKPLLLLAGEIVTGGKQDRVIAKDRIVPAGSDPIDLGVFCIEPGRWTERTAVFGASNKSSAHGIMVQPAVRQRAMVEKDQQQVWASVHGAIASAAKAAAPASLSMEYEARDFGTTSYAQVMQQSEVSGRVDQAASPLIKGGEKILEKLRAEHAVGVVVAIHGEVVWADVFASTDLLARYWTKLVRSYAAESLTASEGKGQATIADAQRFLDAPTSGTESSEGVVGVYRYLELRSGRTEQFVLQSLLPGASYDVHTSRLLMKAPTQHKSRRVDMREPMIVR